MTSKWVHGRTPSQLQEARQISSRLPVTHHWRTYVRSLSNVSHDHLLDSFVSFHNLENVTRWGLHTILRDVLLAHAGPTQWPARILDRIESQFFTPSTVRRPGIVDELQVLVEELQRQINATSRPSIQRLICSLGPSVIRFPSESGHWGARYADPVPGLAGKFRVVPGQVIPKVKEQVLLATGYGSKSDDIAWEVLAHAAYDLDHLVRSCVALDIQQSTLGIAYHCDEPSMLRSMAGSTDFTTRISRILRDLQQQGLQPQLFADHISTQATQLVVEQRLSYIRKVDQLIESDAVPPSSSATVDEQVNQVVALVAPFGVSHPHRPYVEAYVRRFYSAYLTQNRAPDIFNNGFPQELTNVILGYVFTTQISLWPPWEECNNQWLDFGENWRKDFRSGTYGHEHNSYHGLSRACRLSHKAVEEHVLSRAEMTIDLDAYMDRRKLQHIYECAGPCLRMKDRERRIRVDLFGRIPTLHIRLPRWRDEATVPVDTLYSLMDSLRGLKTVRLYFGYSTHSSVWTLCSGQVSPWVMQLLSRIRHPVTLEVQVCDASDDALTGWLTSRRYAPTILRAWVEVTKNALTVDRRGEANWERARQAGNPLCVPATAYPEEWCHATVRLQQALLNQQAQTRMEETPLPDGEEEVLEDDISDSDKEHDADPEDSEDVKDPFAARYGLSHFAERLGETSGDVSCWMDKLLNLDRPVPGKCHKDKYRGYNHLR